MKRSCCCLGLFCWIVMSAVVAQAQPSASTHVVGVLMTYAADDPEGRLRAITLERRLQELGWVLGDQLKIDYHWASTSDPDVLRKHATDLAAAMPELIVGQSTPVLAALRRETLGIPIVFVQVTDPVGSGFVESLAKPGGRITGFTDFEYDIGGKWLELLKEVSPKSPARPWPP